MATTSQDDEGPQNNPNALHVYDMSLDLEDAEGITARHLKSARCQWIGRGRVAGVAMAIEFAGVTYTGTTDSNSIFRTGWITTRKRVGKSEKVVTNGTSADFH